MIIQKTSANGKKAWKAQTVYLDTHLGNTGIVTIAGEYRLEYRYDSYEEARKRYDAVLEFMKNNTVIDGDELRGALDAYVERREGEDKV